MQSRAAGQRTEDGSERSERRDRSGGQKEGFYGILAVLARGVKFDAYPLCLCRAISSEQADRYSGWLKLSSFLCGDR